MDQPISLTALISQLQDLVSKIPNVPSTVPPQPGSDGATAVQRPLLSRSIPPLPLTSSALPSAGSPLPALLTYLSTHILPHLNASALSPNYYGFVIGGTTPAALISDFLVALYDQNVSVHLPSESISTAVEVAALNQLLSLFHLDASTWGIGPNLPGGGTFTTGATASTVLGLALGREFTLATAGRRFSAHPPVSVAEEGLLSAASRAGVHEIRILSALPHSSVLKAAAILGLGRSSFIDISRPTSGGLELDLTKLETEASAPHRACILVVGAGEVNSGRFATRGGLAQWQHLRQICDRLGVWVHVDGAFGLFARLLADQGSDYDTLVAGADGLQLADSITGDGHKMLNVPYDCGFFFTRHKRLSEQVCLNRAAYLKDGGSGGDGGGDGVQTPLNVGLENSRRFRALPVHATLVAYGREGYVNMVKRQVGLARRVVRWLWDQDGYEVLPRGRGEGGVEEAVRETFMIVLFRARDDVVNDGLVDRVKGDGRIYVSGTVWEGKKAARIAVSSWMVDVERDGRLIEEALSDALNM
ncbi:uncharacterized protein HMPREF1541_06064 [Cyphellophora europaea CBS 101466]|uniref:Tyrosine decarboxylase n=1 Tax=Cyphellophora europaea (strain CBS 101466) TaxID=1220924 RepID=W2RVP3_CYPE1|nr:uncharacterized protein HMPREF1541_06064 [Cyphellophora europaea CBS 101466]ETN39838.1 hypothetical protein HMPREF1541_06064 [Cyphellophora europaea CBS 101466]